MSYAFSGELCCQASCCRRISVIHLWPKSNLRVFKKKPYSLYSFLTLVRKTITHDIFHRKELFLPTVAEMFRIKSITVKAEGCGWNWRIFHNITYFQTRLSEWIYLFMIMQKSANFQKWKWLGFWANSLSVSFPCKPSLT